MFDWDSRQRKDDGLEWETPLTEEELAELRESAVKFCNEHGYSDNFTCDRCDARFTCTLAYDAYNTDGDCLAEK